MAGDAGRGTGRIRWTADGGRTGLGREGAVVIGTVRFLHRESAGLVLDAGALIALDCGDRRILLLLDLAAQTSASVTVPASALAQALRSPVRQARLMRLIRQPTTATMPLDGVAASRVGQLLASSGTSDIADAHVVVCAHRAGHPVVTSEPDDLRRLAPP
ncbi:MAG: PIN domain-containing protein [Egibacteraceae bacterium]